MKSIKALAMTLGVIAASAAYAAGLYTNGVPVAGGSQYPSTIPLTGNETIPADTNLGQGLNPASEAITINQLSGYTSQLPSKGNALIGGDSTTNLWQRGTSGTATTSATPAYDGPDRFAQWSTASAQVTVSRDSTAADVPTGYQNAFKLAHTNNTAGQICLGQEVASQNSYQFQGGVSELDFHAFLGAGYTGAATLTAYIYTGTGTDEGISAMAGGTWTGQATATAAVIPLSAVSTSDRLAAVAKIATNTKEIGIAICYTAGTTSTNDYVALAGIQLIRNPAAQGFASATVGYSCSTYPCVSFERRAASLEAYQQYTYFQQWTDNLAATFVLPETCTETTSGTTATCLFELPVTMRTTTPTVTIATAASFGMTKVADGTAEACTTFAVVASTATNSNFKATCAASETAAVGTMHIGLYANTGATSTLTISSEL